MSLQIQETTFHWLLVTRWNSPAARWLLESYSLLVAEIARCKTLFVNCCKIRRLLINKLLVAKNHSLLAANFACYSLHYYLMHKITKKSQLNLVEQNLNELQSIYWIFSMNKSPVLLCCKIANFSIVISRRHIQKNF